MTHEDAPETGLQARLAYLLKHATARLGALHAETLAPFGVDAGDVSALLVIAGDEPPSQQQAARRLGIDPTRMVAVIDSLQDRDLVVRHPDPVDRRRNVVELTDTGRRVLRDATRASDAAERELLAPLDDAQARTLRDSLQRIVLRGEARDAT